ncbi:MAG: c-di-GMP-binding flagellar brake protein YcgR [Pseudohongiellaceae bacterium]|jgi:c-di-GMP-binding flagellar brake protein YcgR
MTDERRRYFRIDETLGVSYRAISDEEAKLFSNSDKGDLSAISYAANFDNRIQTLLEACRIQSPIAAELIDLVNKKLNFVIHQMDVDTDLMQKVAYTLRQVNVSACGMAFPSEDKLKVGQKLQLDILLNPGEFHIVAMAEVVASRLPEEGEGDGNFVRVNFTEIDNNDQELLIQHIVKGQSNQLKRQRIDANNE